MSEFLGKTNSLITFRNSQGVDARGTLLKLSRSTIVLEIYNPYSIVQLSEVLEGMCVRRGDRVIYQGRAVVSNLVNTGLMLIVSATLIDAWSDLTGLLEDKAAIRGEVEQFINDWQEAHQIRPGYQLVVGELRSFLGELSRWLEQIDFISEEGYETENVPQLEDFFHELLIPIQPRLIQLFDKFEQEASLVPEEEVMSHKAFAQRDLHPLIMRSPFAYRTFHKPLGYAGDYQMVNMMVCGTRVGPTIYADLINTINLQTGPAVAHRNRIDILGERLSEKVSKAENKNVEIRVLNIGCGPAAEVQNFIRNDELAESCNFKLIDFNQETLDFAETEIDKARKDSGRETKVEFVHKSVHDLLKLTAKANKTIQTGEYDFVYCAGLFDYLSDKVCRRLIELFYKWVKPGGDVLVTNVHPDNPNRWTMEHVLEWYLIYRNEQQMSEIASQFSEQKIYTDSTGINVFLEIKKSLSENG